MARFTPLVLVFLLGFCMCTAHASFLSYFGFSGKPAAPYAHAAPRASTRAAAQPKQFTDDRKIDPAFPWEKRSDDFVPETVMHYYNAADDDEDFVPEYEDEDKELGKELDEAWHSSGYNEAEDDFLYDDEDDDIIEDDENNNDEDEHGHDNGSVAFAEVSVEPSSYD